MFSMRNDVDVLLVIFDCSVEITKPEERACFNNGLAPLTGVASVLDCCPSSDSICCWAFLVNDGDFLVVSSVQLAAPSMKLDVKDGKWSRSLY